MSIPTEFTLFAECYPVMFFAGCPLYTFRHTVCTDFAHMTLESSFSLVNLRVVSIDENPYESSLLTCFVAGQVYYFSRV